MAFDVGNFIGGLVGTGTNIAAAQNESEAIQHGYRDASAEQTKMLGNIQSTYQPYLTAGAGATSNLEDMLGLNGKTANYADFTNMPGYQFAISQGTQAIQRQASANGNAYTPNTIGTIGQYVTGTAMQDYNTYINQLLGLSKQGADAANNFGNIQYKTGANISQADIGMGTAEAGKYTPLGGIGGGGPGLFGYGGYGPGGMGGVGGGVASLIGKGWNAVKNMWGGGGSSPSYGGGFGNDEGLGFQYGTGPDGTDYSPYVSTGPAPNTPDYGSIPSDNAGNPDWLSGTDYSNPP